MKNLPLEIKFSIAVGMYYFKNYMTTGNMDYLNSYGDVKYFLLKRGYDILPLDI